MWMREGGGREGRREGGTVVLYIHSACATATNKKKKKDKNENEEKQKRK